MRIKQVTQFDDIWWRVIVEDDEDYTDDRDDEYRGDNEYQRHFHDRPTDDEIEQAWRSGQFVPV